MTSEIDTLREIARQKMRADELRARQRVLIDRLPIANERSASALVDEIERLQQLIDGTGQ